MTIIRDNAIVRANARSTRWHHAALGYLGALKAHLQAWRTYKALQRLDDNTLKDIGLDRSEIMSVSFGDSTRRRRN